MSQSAGTALEISQATTAAPTAAIITANNGATVAPLPKAAANDTGVTPDVLQETRGKPVPHH